MCSASLVTKMKIYPVNIERFSNHSTASGFHEDLRGVFKRWKHTPVDLFTEDGYYVNNLKESVEVTTGRGLTFGDWDALIIAFFLLAFNVEMTQKHPNKETNLKRNMCNELNSTHVFFSERLDFYLLFWLGAIYVVHGKNGLTSGANLPMMSLVKTPALRWLPGEDLLVIKGSRCELGKVHGIFFGSLDDLGLVL